MTSKPVAQLLVDLGVARSQPAPRVERQPLQRGQLQDPEVLLLVPRPLRVDPGRPGVPRRLLHVLQPRAPAPGPAPAHAGLGPLRHRHGRLDQAAEVIGEALTAGRPRAHYRLGADAPVIEFLEFVLPAGSRTAWPAPPLAARSARRVAEPCRPAHAAMAPTRRESPVLTVAAAPEQPVGLRPWCVDVGSPPEGASSPHAIGHVQRTRG
jgi:hypothetical protein